LCTFFIQSLKMKKNTLKNSFFCWQWPLVWQRVCLHWRIFSWLICDCLTFVIVWRIFSWLICDCLTATYNSCFCFDVVLLPISFRHNDRPTDRSTDRLSTLNDDDNVSGQKSSWSKVRKMFIVHELISYHELKILEFSET
jgi:hypothetical protein